MSFLSIANSSAFVELNDYIRSSTCVIPPLTYDRWKRLNIQAAGLDYIHAATYMTPPVMTLFQSVANDCRLIDQYRALRSGAIVNQSENRSVDHHRLREPRPDSFFMKEWSRIKKWVTDLQAAPHDEGFDTIVQIGIGGSELGPRMVYEALTPYANQYSISKRPVHFISNLDVNELTHLMQTLSLSRTLFLVVSKSGTTMESRSLFDTILTNLPPGLSRTDFIKRHVISITSRSSTLPNDYPFRESFFITDEIGGRFSVTSACGALMIAMAYTPDVFDELLTGAHLIDTHALNTDISKNMVMLDAMYNVVARNCFQFPAQAIIPYLTALKSLPAYLQQLENESNGKPVNRQNVPLSYPCSSFIFGEPGTNAQHSFFQYLHQGSPVCPIQLIGFYSAQNILNGSHDITRKSLAHLLAQTVAFSNGDPNDNPQLHFAGNRPVTVLLAKFLTPRIIGALISFYENRTMFQGFLWDINSFDQEGVGLGKRIANQILDHSCNADVQAIFSEMVASLDDSLSAPL